MFVLFVVPPASIALLCGRSPEAIEGGMLLSDKRLFDGVKPGVIPGGRRVEVSLAFVAPLVAAPVLLIPVMSEALPPRRETPSPGATSFSNSVRGTEIIAAELSTPAPVVAPRSGFGQDKLVGGSCAFAPKGGITLQLFSR